MTYEPPKNSTPDSFIYLTHRISLPSLPWYAEECLLFLEARVLFHGQTLSANRQPS